jgi:membrane-bound serine protease (ClpP class)
MIDESTELKIDGELINKEGRILTLTNLKAEKEYGQPPKPLLSLGTVATLDDLLKKLGLQNAQRTNIEPTGAERAAFWLNAIAPLLLIIGVIGIYIEFKTPGFGLPGIVGIIAFALYFLGNYVAGLSGVEWVAFFLLGLVLVALELFVFPGVMILGGVGALLMLASVMMAMVDLYPAMPAAPGVPALPRVSSASILGALQTLVIAAGGAGLAFWALGRYLPRTPLYAAMVSHGVSGAASAQALEQKHQTQLGQVGRALSVLRPGGKAQFGDEIMDVMSQGELIARGTTVKIIGFSGAEAIVETAG